ncbi:flagellar assembly peptidoglycan hydrolase FlgJ [Thiohalobacter sp.]|uniref:flagellar assembly peptidoglycan hydrolase FlgJ n=1 Tax=Thiohalobacter sp. TaxID=2025948 RepID=UPI002614A291|nr:flagellar assembly peptidoglycan hydrolase FlgJ [Thiohalobacter sp.]
MMGLSADPSVYTDLQGLAALRGQVRADGGRDPETLRKVAGQFEALFVNMVLKSMREASLGDGFLDNDQTRFYQGMYDQQIGLELTKGRGLGLADMLVRQLGGGSAAEARPRSPSDPFAIPPVGGSPSAPTGPRMPPGRVAPRTAFSSGETRAAAPDAALDWPPGTPAEFVRSLWPHAREAAAGLGVDPAVLIAQAALESGWGRRMPRHEDGRPSYNLFGIKADRRWAGERVGSGTLEYRDGVVNRERAVFRAYASPADSMADYAAFIRGSTRYREALARAGDAESYVRAIADAGYATDPAYADKVMRIYRGPELRDALAALQGPRRLAMVDEQGVD